MAITTLVLRSRSRIRIKCNTFTLTHRFSTSNSDDGDPDSKPKSPFSSYFTDVKERLKKNPPTPISPLRTSPSFTSSTPNLTTNHDFDEIRKNISEFRRRTSAPIPGDDQSSEPVSFLELYNKNVPERSGGSARNSGGGPSFDAIRQSMQKLRSSATKQGSDPMSLPAFQNSLRWSPSSDSGSSLIGGTGEIPTAVFAKELREKRDPGAAGAMSTEFLRMYSHEELGKKLRALRPEGGRREGFSLGELNERLIRLREIEKESLPSTIGAAYQEMIHSLETLKQSDLEKDKKISMQRLDIFGHLGRTSTSMDPPKENLVERYFHPDNMSSAEKLKIQLAKVRDEFKMSESDCGSARVQVAQLTTKIKHLSSVLHKKDKHSRKGLVAMVQRRKRLLKYLRSTDWDSYCFVISKLGLRDNPDIKY